VKTYGIDRRVSRSGESVRSVHSRGTRIRDRTSPSWLILTNEKAHDELIATVPAPQQRARTIKDISLDCDIDAQIAGTVVQGKLLDGEGRALGSVEHDGFGLDRSYSLGHVGLFLAVGSGKGRDGVADVEEPEEEAGESLWGVGSPASAAIVRDELYESSREQDSR